MALSNRGIFLRIKRVSQFEDSDIKHIKERIADTHDLQAEISLEGERFSEAVTEDTTVDFPLPPSFSSTALSFLRYRTRARSKTSYYRR
jgi:hypothetical protein